MIAWPMAVYAESANDKACESILGLWAEQKGDSKVTPKQPFTDVYINFLKNKSQYELWLMVGPDLFRYEGCQCAINPGNEVTVVSAKQDRKVKFIFKRKGLNELWIVEPRHLRYGKESFFVKAKAEWTFIPKNIRHPKL